MAEHIERLVAARRLDSARKAAQVLAALDAMALSGQAVNVAALARKALVSRRFIYDHPELRAETERRCLEAVDSRASAFGGSARVTTASLRADLENLKATNRRLEQDHAALRRRLGQAFGREMAGDMVGQGVVDNDRATAARVAALEQQLFESREQLSRCTDELAAARQINRELMARLNRGRT